MWFSLKRLMLTPLRISKLNEAHFIPLMISIASFISILIPYQRAPLSHIIINCGRKKEGNKSEQKPRLCHEKRNKKNA